MRISRLDVTQFDHCPDVRIGDGQETFAKNARAFIAANEPSCKSGLLVPFIIEHQDTPIGFFVIGRDTTELQPIIGETQRAGVLRNFIIDARHQGRGYAKAALLDFRATLARELPDVERLYLTVNVRNTGAQRAYLRSGCTDLERYYLGGSAGPQHVYKLDLRTPRD